MRGEQLHATGRDLADLLRVQTLLATGRAPDARLLMARARLLASAGAPDAARADAALAHATDPDDPLPALSLAALSPPDIAHALACQIITSAHAAPRLRQAAVTLIDPDALPPPLSSLLPAVLRLTVLHRPGVPLDVPGPQVPLCTTGPLHATDILFDRGQQARRVDLGGASFTVPPLPAPAPVATADGAASLWVVVPVKDGGAMVAACLRSVLQARADLPDLQLIVVDDGSRDPATLDLLQDIAAAPQVQLIRNATSRGFTAAVNAGLARVGQGPVLMLNSDTWLPPATLSRMLAHLADPTVGTVTPLTNNGGSFSVPTPRRGHAMPDEARARAIAAQAAQRNRGIGIDMLTGNGFAMLISGACLRATGALSAHYDSGYYEEVDFCLRARALGFRHLAAADCFVPHVGAVSYGAARQRLTAANLRRLNARFPGYHDDFLRLALTDPLAPFRARLTEASALAPLPGTAPPWPDPPAVATLPAEVMPVTGDHAARACRTLAPVAAAAGLHIVPQVALQSAGLVLRPAHGMTANPTGAGLTVTDAQGRAVGVLTPGPQAAELALRLAAGVRGAKGQAQDGLSI